VHVGVSCDFSFVNHASSLRGNGSGYTIFFPSLMRQRSEFSQQVIDTRFLRLRISIFFGKLIQKVARESYIEGLNPFVA